MKKVLLRLLVVVLILAVLGWLLYPTVADQLARKEHLERTEKYLRTVRSMGSEKLTEMLEDADEANGITKEMKEAKAAEEAAKEAAAAKAAKEAEEAEKAKAAEEAAKEAEQARAAEEAKEETQRANAAEEPTKEPEKADTAEAATTEPEKADATDSATEKPVKTEKIYQVDSETGEVKLVEVPVETEEPTATPNVPVETVKPTSTVNGSAGTEKPTTVGNEPKETVKPGSTADGSEETVKPVVTEQLAAGNEPKETAKPAATATVKPQETEKPAAEVQTEETGEENLIRPGDVFTGRMERASAKYRNLLDFGDGMIGVLEIPSIHVSLPIVHSGTEHRPDKELVHVEGSSLPGETGNTHTVLAGPRKQKAAGILGDIALTGDRMLEDLDRVTPGEQMMILLGNRTLLYEVHGVQTLSPDGLKEWVAERNPEEDRLTLITERDGRRLLVEAVRIPVSSATEALKSGDAANLPADWVTILALGSPVMLLVLLVMIIIERIKKRVYRLPNEGKAQQIETIFEDEEKNEAGKETKREDRNEDKGEAKNETGDEAKDEGKNETGNEVKHEDKNETGNEDQNEDKNEAEKETKHGTGKEAKKKAKKKARNEA